MKTPVTLKIVSVPAFFAPSVEPCEIKYRLIRKGMYISKMAHLKIVDKSGVIVYTSSIIGIGSDGDSSVIWDGKDKTNKNVTPFQSPFTITFSMQNNPNIKAVSQTQVKIGTIPVWVDSTSGNKIYMNNPATKVDVAATVMLMKSDGTNVATKIPFNVLFTYTDVGTPNTNKLKSYKYTKSPDKYLGKKNDASAIYWHDHPKSISQSDNGYKTSCKVQSITTGTDKGKAFIYFIPSGVGGDTFKLKASVISADGSTTLAFESSKTMTIWRKITFDKIYEMDKETHVSTNATAAKISPAYIPAKVEYLLGTKNNLSNTYSQDYIGLWKDTTTPQKSWTTLQRKKADETPSRTEINNANYSGTEAAKINLRNTARGDIIKKAQKWADRIDSDFKSAMTKWARDARIPSNIIVSIRYYHPKYSLKGGKYKTNQWKLGGSTTPSWLRISACKNSRGVYQYNNLDPDELWANWGGIYHGKGIVSVPKGNGASIVKTAVLHESGHATKYHFKRQDFGPSLDHSVSNAGIMYKDTFGGTTFSFREIKILRGIIP